MKLPYYSWVLPIKNEEESLPQLFQEIKAVMTDKNFSARGGPASGWEVIAVNDASTDATLTTLKSLTSQIPQLKIINLPSHQGKWAALLAGFKKARGEIIITLDSDLQDDPGQAIALLAKIEQGYNLVSGWRKARVDPYYKVFISTVGNILVSILSRRRFRDLNSPFKAYRKAVLHNLPQQGSMLRFTMLFTLRLGYKVTEIPVVHRPRIYGKSKFRIVKYLRILYDLLLVLLLFSGSGKLTKQK